MNKLMTLEEAASCVPSHGMLALGGMTIYRRPMAFVFALLRRCLESIDRNGGLLPNHLTLMSFAASLESDLLVGSGMVSRVRTCYFGMEIFGLAPMFTDFANRGKLEVMEETEASLS